MAQVDPNIALSIRQVQIPLEESPLNRMQRYAEYENALLKSQEYQRDIKDKNELAKLLSGPNVDLGSPDFMRQVLTRAPRQAKTVLELAGAQEAIAKRKVEEQKLAAETAQKNRDQIKAAAQELASYTSFDDALRAIDRNVGSGLLTEVQGAALKAELPSDPAAFPAWQKQKLTSYLTIEQQLSRAEPKIKEVDIGGAIKFIDVNPNSPTYNQEVGPKSIEKTPTPAAATDPELVKEYKFATDPARGKDRFTGSLLQFKEAVAKAGRPISTTQAAPTVTMVLDPSDSTRMLSVDAKTYRGGSLGSTGVIGIAGKEPTVGKKQEAKETAQNNAATIIAKLRQSYDRLDELGGITSTENRAGTNISARMGASSVGQTVGSFFGTKTQAERDKIEQTRPLLMTTIMQALGLTAKQLDSNAELKLWLSSATDPTKSLEANREALNELERLLTGEGKSAGAKAKRPLAFKPTSDLFNAADAIIGKQP